MDPKDAFKRWTRREFFRTSATGVAGAALASLFNGNLYSPPPVQAGPFSPKPPHFAPTAKRVIYLSMIGAPSQLDLFDDKPELRKLDGEPIPESFLEGRRFPFLKGVPHLLSSPWKFETCGSSGMTVSELLPHLKDIVDEVTFIKSLHTNEINHVPAQLLLATGSPRQGRPAMGSWVTYGLGSEAEDLPAFVVLASGKAGRCGTACFGSGFLPSVHQGVQFRSKGDPVLFLTNPEGLSEELRRESLDALNALNQEQLSAMGDPEIETRIEAFEMAYKMQTSVPELMDISSEPVEMHRLYGTEPGKVSFANNCLLARRLIERGVRFVQLAHGGWDHHGGLGDQNLVTNLPERTHEVDQGSAALIKDLKQRGLLEDTLVIWGGEFGRTCMLQGTKSSKEMGRDHNISAYTIWMAGGGIKAGYVHGETDEIGMNSVSDPVHVHDLQATVLHTLGLDHERLTFKFQGRDYRLTDVHGNVVKKILA
jgi:uncharacterized protein (DUF1501 family)